jgi:RNA polymerase-binding protein DksA
MSSVDLDVYREKLLEERRRVLAALDFLHLENAGSQEDEVAETPLDNHLAENASVTHDRELDYTLEENSTHVLGAIDVALDRIAEGSYGMCVTCGRQIDEERLAALPYASQCIDCRRREEQG